MPSKAREGLNALLAQRPDGEVWRIESQGTYGWTIVDLYEGPDIPVHVTDRLKLVKYAIWNYTGNVYELEEDGSVKEDPFIFVTPWPEPSA